MNRILLAISFLAGVALSAGAAPLRCNFVSTDITTTAEEHTMLAGFAARSKLSDGVHTDLRASCLAVTDGSRKIVIMSLDMMELSPSLSSEIRDSISARSGLDKEDILIHCIHTHSAPRVGGRWVEEGAPNRSFKERFEATVIDLAVRTVSDDKAFRPFTMETGRTTVTFNGNRCEKEGPCDHDVYAVRLLDRRGKPICAFINLSCHPVCMGPKSTLVGADYSGVARKAIAQKWGCEVFQLSGAQGNVDPAMGPKQYEYAEQCGNSLADSLETIVFSPLRTGGGLRLQTGVARLPYRIPAVTVKDIRTLADSLIAGARTSFPRFADDVEGWYRQMAEEIGPDQTITSLDVNMTAVNLGGLVIFFTQGEPFCEYQQAARAAFPGETLIFAAYTNGQNAYIPSQRAFDVRKGYEYELEQDFVYVKRPYPLSSQMPKVFEECIFKTISRVVDAPAWNVIPEPLSIQRGEGCFRLRRGMAVKADPEFADAAAVFSERISASTGIRLRGRNLSGRGISLIKVGDLAPEAYRLDVGKSRVRIEASDYAGAYYGLQTLLQLLPAKVFCHDVQEGVEWTAPCCRVTDAPRFPYRGMQLDCGRHFFSKEEVMKFIDLMSIHKQNYLQWHLTEDQGWRIEIKKYPLLTEVGAWRTGSGCGPKDEPVDSIRYGGFYTQEEVREIVEYARRRAVTIVPEIELPGHSSAAIAAYPWLSCTPGEPKEVANHRGVCEDVYCPRPETFRFLEDVFDEILTLFPSPYYHIGGDECPTTAWENSEYCRNLVKEKGMESVSDIQDLFVNHFNAYLRERGKTVIGWDEIMDGDPDPSTVVMSYRGHGPAQRAAMRGMKTILCPNRFCYYDYHQQAVPDEAFFHYLFITLRKSYNWDWTGFMSEESLEKDNILGMQACLWTEDIADDARLEHQTFPREATIAETSWTAQENRNWNRFKARLPKEFERLEAYGVDYSRAYDNVLVYMDLLGDYPRNVELSLDNPQADIRYTRDASGPDASSPIAPAYFRISKGDTLSARGFLPDGTPIGEVMTRIF